MTRRGLFPPLRLLLATALLTAQLVQQAHAKKVKRRGRDTERAARCGREDDEMSIIVVGGVGRRASASAPRTRNRTIASQFPSHNSAPTATNSDQHAPTLTPNRTRPRRRQTPPPRSAPASSSSPRTAAPSCCSDPARTTTASGACRAATPSRPTGRCCRRRGGRWRRSWGARAASPSTPSPESPY